MNESPERPQHVSSRNFLGGLSPSHFEVFRALMQPAELGDGELLFGQGERSDVAYFIDDGSVELVKRLSSGREIELDTRHEGEVIGETALLTPTRRSFSARAHGPVRALAVGRNDFRSLLAYYHPASLAVLRRLALLTASRILDMTNRILGEQNEPEGSGTPAESSLDGLTPAATEEPGFDVREFLPEFDFFAAFSAEDIDRFLEMTQASLQVLPRGATIQRYGEDPAALHLVVRGVVERIHTRGRAVRRVGVITPGGLIGELCTLLGLPWIATARTRESATLYQIPRDRLMSLIDSGERVAFKTLEAVTLELIERLQQLDRIASQLERSAISGTHKVIDRPSHGPQRVLVVDDNPMNRGVLRIHCEEMGHEVLEAEDGQEALDIVEDEMPDAILLDVRMPVMDGYETLRQLKTDSASRNIPVIMITAVDSMDSAVRCLRLGAEDYLPRTFDESMLRARLDACLEQGRVLG